MTATLDHEFRLVLIQLELTSNGATQSWNASGGGSGHPDDRVVFQVISHEEAAHDRYKRRYEGCRNDKQRKEVCEEASEELEAIRVRQAPADLPWVPVETLIVEDCEGLEPLMVASRFNLHAAYVRRIRIAAGRDPETGLSGASLLEQAVEMEARKVTQVEIARRLGVSQASVCRLLKQARDAAKFEKGRRRAA